MTILPRLEIGARVEKFTGKHRYKGRVINVQREASGALRYTIRIDRGHTCETDGFGWRVDSKPAHR